MFSQTHDQVLPSRLFSQSFENVDRCSFYFKSPELVASAVLASELHDSSHGQLRSGDCRLHRLAWYCVSSSRTVTEQAHDRDQEGPWLRNGIACQGTVCQNHRCSTHPSDWSRHSCPIRRGWGWEVANRAKENGCQANVH